MPSQDRPARGDEANPSSPPVPSSYEEVVAALPPEALGEFDRDPTRHKRIATDSTIDEEEVRYRATHPPLPKLDLTDYVQAARERNLARRAEQNRIIRAAEWDRVLSFLKDNDIELYVPLATLDAWGKAYINKED
jgi:hypothetical protein